MITITSPQTLNSFEVLSFSDDAKLRMVTARVRTNLDERTVVLWLGEAYDAAGQYTDANITARVEALLSAP
jgi:hypothetical protein